MRFQFSSAASKLRLVGAASFAPIGLLLCSVTAALSGSLAGQAPSLGAASNFAVLAASTVANAGASNLRGDVGVAPGTSITGFPPAILIGTLHAGDPIAVQAEADALLAYASMTANVCGTDLTGQDLGGLVLAPGTYCFDVAATLAGTLTLDGQGQPGAVFVIRTGSTLTTAVASAVALVNGATAENVYWRIGSSATLGTGSTMVGTMIAQASITASAGAVVSGRLIALTAAVTMDTVGISRPTAATTSSIGPGCGAPAPSLSAIGLPTLGNASFALTTTTAPGATAFLFHAFAAGNTVLAPGCTLYLDAATMTPYGWFFVADGAGVSVIPVPVPLTPALEGLPVYWQAAEAVPAGPVLGSFAISNGLLTLLGAA